MDPTALHAAIAYTAAMAAGWMLVGWLVRK
jgi:hypothetical protein